MPLSCILYALTGLKEGTVKSLLFEIWRPERRKKISVYEEKKEGENGLYNLSSSHLSSSWRALPEALIAVSGEWRRRGGVAAAGGVRQGLQWCALLWLCLSQTRKKNKQAFIPIISPEKHCPRPHGLFIAAGVTGWLHVCSSLSQSSPSLTGYSLSLISASPGGRKKKMVAAWRRRRERRTYWWNGWARKQEERRILLTLGIRGKAEKAEPSSPHPCPDSPALSLIPLSLPLPLIKLENVSVILSRLSSSVLCILCSSLPK